MLGQREAGVCFFRSRVGCVDAVGNSKCDSACSAAVDFQCYFPPPPRLFLIEEGEGNSWEGVEEGARPHEKLMEMYRRVF